MRKVNLPHKITIRVSDKEKEFLDSLNRSNSEIFRRALILYMFRIAEIRRYLG
jgi:hypothetical protein